MRHSETGHPWPFPVLVACALALGACSSSSSDDPDAATPADDGENVGVRGTLTLDDHDWFAVESALGIVEIALPSGERRRILDGSKPWRHPSGKITFAQGCGDRVNRIALAQEGSVTPISGCSDAIPNPGFLRSFHDHSRLSPDEALVAAEVGYYQDDGYLYSIVVYDLAGDVVTSFGGKSPAWLPDGRLLYVNGGLMSTDTALGNPVRLDDGQLGGELGYIDVDPTGTVIAAEYNQQIWQLNLATGQAGPLVSGPKRLRYPTFSPDGATLAYLAASNGDRFDKAIYLTDLRTGEAGRVDYPTSESSNVPNGPMSWTR